MKRATFGVAALCILLWCSAVLAEEKSAGGQTQTSGVERARGQAQNLSPEERAKLREKRATMSAEERAQARTQMREQVAGNRPGAEAVRQKSAAEQIATLKQEHQAVMTDLQNIRQLAAKEKAAETIKALDSLITRHQQEYQKRLQQMEQRLQRAQAAQKGAAQTTPNTDVNESAAQKRVRAAEKRRQK